MSDSLELEAHLREQIGFLHSSNRAYDDGDRPEAKRLAVAARVLCHDTSASHSLLSQLQMKGRLLFSVSGDELPPSGSGFFMGGMASWGLFEGTLWHPILTGFSNYAPVPFEPWWTGRAMRATSGLTISRRQIVLWLANKSGGAHIDELPEALRSLNDGSSMSIRLRQRSTSGAGDPVIPESPIPAAMRTISAELLDTLVPPRYLDTI